MAGKNKYLPMIVIDELEDLKVEHGIVGDAAAMGKMVEYTRVGREVERLTKFKFGHKPTKRKASEASLFGRFL